MILYLLRHAIAEARDPMRWPDDSERPLTDDGRRKMQKIAKGIASMGLGVQTLLSSPYTRARETAEIAAAQFRLQVRYTAALTPEGNFESLVGEIQVLREVESVMLVGHEPDLSDVACRLLTGQPGGWMVMKKGGLCKISVEHLDIRYPRARLDWLLTPKLLRRLV